MRLLSSRRRIVVFALVLLLALDAGRSMFARIGYARPVSVWQPDSSAYVDLSWPPGGGFAPETPLGKRVYAQRCAVCHGPDGRGNGPAAPSLTPRPRDFTLGQFSYKSTAADQPPTDADLISVVANGLHASAMPFWRDVLDSTEIRAVVEHVKSLSAAFGGPAPRPLPISRRVPPGEASLARGRDLYASKGCAGCHGADGRGDLILTDSKGHRVIARDLSAPWTFRGGASPEQIWLRITTGLVPAGMPPFAATTTESERWDLVNYTLSLARVAPWEPGGELDGPGHTADPVRRGEYLVRAEMCGLCHTTINRTGIYRGDDFYLAGGMRVGLYPHGYYVSRNLTSDPETGIGRWSEQQLANAIRNGRTPTRLLNPIAMPWGLLHALTEEDALAIGAYLKTLPPVTNRIPDPLHFGAVETIVMKLAAGLPVAIPKLLSYADGNFGETGSGPTRELPQRILNGAQWVVLILAILLLFIPREPRVRPGEPPARRHRLRTAALIASLAVAGALGALIIHTPTLSFLPPEQVADAIGARIARPRPAVIATPEQAALAQRGRYVYSVASCALCHSRDGSGGLKVCWKPFGTLWVRNVSPDSATGIGAWSDAQVARAIRSGVSHDGRALHWQGMIWDHASNWDEEDVRALVAYLRSIPPVRRTVPEARAPAPDDCDIYSFWISPSDRPGCR